MKSESPDTATAKPVEQADAFDSGRAAASADPGSLPPRVLAIWHESASGTGPPPPTASELLAQVLPRGTLLEGKYRVHGLLGQGGMGIVFHAWDETLDRPVAIKLILHGAGDDELARVRLKREASAMARLRHPNLAQVYSLGYHDAHFLFVVLEYVAGVSIRELLQANAREHRLFSERQVGNLIFQACEGLAHAHGLGLAHRDVKPANMMVNLEGRLVLLDFGLAKGLADPSLTSPGGLMGTPAYSAPEQVRGIPVPPEQMHLADIYGIGATAYEMLTGSLVLPQCDTMEARLEHLEERPLAPSARRPELDPAWDAILLRALSCNLVERFPTIRSLQEALLTIPAVREGVEHQHELVLPHPELQQLISLERRVQLRLALTTPNDADWSGAGATAAGDHALASTASMSDPEGPARPRQPEVELDAELAGWLLPEIPRPARGAARGGPAPERPGGGAGPEGPAPPQLFTDRSGEALPEDDLGKTPTERLDLTVPPLRKLDPPTVIPPWPAVTPTNIHAAETAALPRDPVLAVSHPVAVAEGAAGWNHAIVEGYAAAPSPPHSRARPEVGAPVQGWHNEDTLLLAAEGVAPPRPDSTPVLTSVSARPDLGPWPLLWGLVVFMLLLALAGIGVILYSLISMG